MLAHYGEGPDGFWGRSVFRAEIFPRKLADGTSVVPFLRGRSPTYKQTFPKTGPDLPRVLQRKGYPPGELHCATLRSGPSHSFLDISGWSKLRQKYPTICGPLPLPMCGGAHVPWRVSLSPGPVTIHPSPLGPSPPSIWTRFPDNLVLVTGVFGPGPLLPLGLSPASMASSAVWGTISGPGPRREMGPRPKTYQGMSNNALDLVHGAQLAIRQALIHQWVHQKVHPCLLKSLRLK